MRFIHKLLCLIGWHGPRAADLELRHVNEEIRRLVARKLELEIKMGLA